VTPETFDHVALWVADRDPIADFVTSRVGMHVVDRTDAFTLVGSNARRGKLTLFAAEGPREQGALKHVALRVSRLNGALRGLEGVEVDLDHAALYSRSPDETAREYERLGFSPVAPGPSGAPRVEVGGAYVEFHEGDPGTPERPLLNHLAVLVDSADEHIAEARELGIEIADIVDAANTYALFVWGPERVKVEYVEHKPTFSLT
jgi:catechol 2,3-dioxygenase-like lactoylglutathione lyase family enzyme